MSNYAKSAFADELELNNPEYATPLGIAVSAALGLLNDSYVVTLNGESAKLFRSGVLTLRDILLMNGYTYADLLGRSGKNLSVTLDGRHVLLRGEPAAPAVLRVNDADAPITTVIHAGDCIQFTPARSGTDAAKTLGELLGTDFSGRVLLNNQEAPLNTPLRQGDVILTLEKKTVSPQPERAPAAQPTIPPVPVSAARSVPPPPAPTLKVAPVPPSVSRPVPRKRTLDVVLNGKPLVLPAKENDQPYYVMDLLERSGLDLEHLDRPVQLAVNGEECGFRQVLKDRDSVTIR